MTGPPAEALWPILHYEDTARALDFLTGALGFEAGVVVCDGEDHIVHAELHRPGGGGSLVIGRIGRGAGVHEDIRVGGAALYIATDRIDAAYERARDARAEIVRPPHETVFGTGIPTRAFTVADPEGILWTVGTYRGGA